MSRDPGMLSVVIPLYNKEREISRAVESVLNQTYSSIELVVVNDGSTDRGPEIVEQHSDHRVRIIHQPNRGASAARNAGINNAAYDLVAFIDADDEWKPTFLETIVRLAGKFPEAGAYATGFLADHGRGRIARARAQGVPSKPWEGLVPNYFKGISIVCSSAVAIRKHVFHDVGYFREGVRIAGDLDMWIRVAAVYPIAYSSEPKAIYHKDASNRVCVQHTISRPLFIRRSLAQIEQDPRLAREVKNDARRYIARFELLAVHTIHRSGRLRRARRLARMWKEEYGASIGWRLLKLKILLVPPALAFQWIRRREQLIAQAAGLRARFRAPTST